MSRAQKVALWIAKRLPNVLIKEPERFFISVCSVLLGLIILVYFHSDEEWVDASYIIWAFGFIIGGLAKGYALLLITSHGYMKSMMRVQTAKAFERLGASLIGICCLVYALRPYSRGEFPFIVMIFAGLGLTNLIRFVVSVAGFAPLVVERHRR